MDIGNALRRAGRDDITIRSIIANTTQNIYFEKTWVQISISSIQLRWKKVLIKTGNALINSELQLMQESIKKASLEKLWTMSITLSKELTFRFI